jgi:hypothetical protein
MTHDNSQNIRAIDWRVMAVKSQNDCKCFIRDNHYAMGCPKTSVYRHGLYRWDNEHDCPVSTDLYGVAMWLPPIKIAAVSVACAEWARVLSLTRLAVHPIVPRGGASFLLGGSMKQIDSHRWPVLLTYADTAHGHTGAIYKATSWIELGLTKAGATYIDRDGMQCGRKRGGKNLTAQEVLDRGMVRLPQLGKIKFVHYDKHYKGFRAKPYTLVE